MNFIFTFLSCKPFSIFVFTSRSTINDYTCMCTHYIAISNTLVSLLFVLSTIMCTVVKQSNAHHLPIPFFCLLLLNSLSYVASGPISFEDKVIGSNACKEQTVCWEVRCTPTCCKLLPSSESSLVCDHCC